MVNLTQYIRCPNGEIINPSSGLVVNYDDFVKEVPTTTDAETLLKHWDGYAIGPLGTVPKVIALSVDEQRLLSKLRPWKFFKKAVREDYRKLINKINKQRMSALVTIQNKNQQADPEYRARQLTIHRSPEMFLKYSKISKEKWRNPVTRERMINGMLKSWTPDARLGWSRQTKKMWQDPKFKDKALHRRRTTIAWRTLLAPAMKLLFDKPLGPLKCPHSDCDRAFNTPRGLSIHLGTIHKGFATK